MNKINLQIYTSLEKDKGGIWQYHRYLAPVEEKFRLSLDEGHTSIQKINEIYLKREDQNPTGSLKDRGMAFLVSELFSKKAERLVLSSSGNAAISAGSYCQIAGIKLTVFVSEKIESRKLEVLKNLKTEIIFSQKPVSDSIKYARTNNFINLRPSSNKYGSEGYQTIAFELAKELGKIDDIFIPVSSGTALCGIYSGFIKLGIMPRIHLCQSSAVHFLSDKFDKDFHEEKDSLARALVAKTTPLSSAIFSALKKSGGTGWTIGNEEISKASETLKTFVIDTSFEGALAFAAIKKAQKLGWPLGKTVCLLTGKRYN